MRGKRCSTPHDTQNKTRVHRGRLLPRRYQSSVTSITLSDQMRLVTRTRSCLHLHFLDQNFGICKVLNLSWSSLLRLSGSNCYNGFLRRYVPPPSVNQLPRTNTLSSRAQRTTTQRLHSIPNAPSSRPLHILLHTRARRYK